MNPKSCNYEQHCATYSKFYKRKVGFMSHMTYDLAVTLITKTGCRVDNTEFGFIASLEKDNIKGKPSTITSLIGVHAIHHVLMSRMQRNILDILKSMAFTVKILDIWMVCTFTSNIYQSIKQKNPDSFTGRGGWSSSEWEHSSAGMSNPANFLTSWMQLCGLNVTL